MGYAEMFSHLTKSLSGASGKCGSAARKLRGEFRWRLNYLRLRKPKVDSWAAQSPEQRDEIEEELLREGFELADIRVDRGDYLEYLRRARYDRFPDYAEAGQTSNLAEKTLQHYLAARLLNLTEDDVYLDIASSNSPTPEIYREMYGCATFRQDLSRPEGLHGNVIGGNAMNMPVEAGFAGKMALHCAFEHFEQDSDIGFVIEAGRVLKPGGKVCILPLYLHTEYVVLTDLAVVSPLRSVPFDEDAKVYCARNWGNRHGRAYDVAHLDSRIRRNLGDMKMVIHVLRNAEEIDPSCYTRYIALLEKPG
jgi:SAM-dependent methyltransferase